MAALRMEWTLSSKAQFEELKKRAAATGKGEQFKQAHNEIVNTLREAASALEKGELLYRTQRPGGEVRHWICHFLSVCFVVFRDEQVGWILKYNSVPESWPR
jgi:hypothetical protein